jgi:hypothetical protein
MRGARPSCIASLVVVIKADPGSLGFREVAQLDVEEAPFSAGIRSMRF